MHFLEKAKLLQSVKNLRQRMLHHQVVNETAVVALSAQELDQLLSFIEISLEED